MKKQTVFLALFMLVFAFSAPADSFSQTQSSENYGKPVLKNRVFFDLSKSDLNSPAAKILGEIASLLTLYKENVLVIEGHADNTGEKKSNMALSMARAQAVYDFLAGQGIEKYRMKIVHYGDQKPLGDNSAEDGRSVNRRAELIIFKAGG